MKSVIHSNSNKTKLCLGAGIVVTATAGYYMYKYLRKKDAIGQIIPQVSEDHEEIQEHVPVVVEHVEHYEQSGNKYVSLYRSERTLDYMIFAIVVILLVVSVYSHTMFVYSCPLLFLWLRYFIYRRDNFAITSQPVVHHLDLVEEKLSEHITEFEKKCHEYLMHPYGLNSNEWYVCPYKLSYVYHYPFEQVVNKMWNRFPDPKLPGISCKVISNVIEDNFVLRHRSIQSIVKVPYLLRALFQSDIAEFEEKSVESHQERKLRIHTLSKTYTNIVKGLTITEYCEHPQNSRWTLLTQEMGMIAGSGVGMFKGKVYDYGCKRFESESIEQAERLNEQLDEKLN